MEIKGGRHKSLDIFACQSIFDQLTSFTIESGVLVGGSSIIKFEDGLHAAKLVLYCYFHDYK